LITKAESKAIWEQVKANHARLETCVGPHDFQDITPDKPLAKRYRCSKCNGEAEGTNVHWYERGLKHAQKAGAP
jgi:hypothetical protein